MSGAVKRRGAAPTAPTGAPPPDDVSGRHGKKGVASNGSAAPSHSLTYPAEVSDDVNMNEVDGLVTLNVTLPNGQQTDINVDFNTPMLDLLVCLAGKSKLSPSGLALQLVSEDTGKPMAYKPNQTIGSLGGRLVRLVSKDELSGKNKAKNTKKGQQPFEMTHRFTMNLPRGQKAVVRVSPLTVLGELVTSVCQDKGLDLRRHVLQIPGQPGVPVDLRATIQQVGVHEMNLITVPLQERNHTQSMPDLSKPPPKDTPFPTYMPGAGEQKKKRGFLSFLKKDKKFKPAEAQYNMETSSTTSHMMSSAQSRRTSTPPSQRRGSDVASDTLRPKSMFVTSQPTPEELAINRSSAAAAPPPTAPVAQPQIPTKKKRRAPAPPVPTSAQQNQNHPPQLPPPASSAVDETASNNSSNAAQATNTTQAMHNSKSLNVASAPVSAREEAGNVASSQQVSRAEMLSRLHSRNSSDSSGYHELTLSGCESPEAMHHLTTKSKTSIDTTSIESADNANGDSGIHESPIRVSPIEEVQEKADSPAPQPSVPSHSSSSLPAAAEFGSTDTLLSKKRRKAPAPPAPAPVPTPPAPSVSAAITVEDSHLVSAATATANADEVIDVAIHTSNSVQAHSANTRVPLEMPVEVSMEPSPSSTSTQEVSHTPVADEISQPLESQNAAQDIGDSRLSDYDDEDADEENAFDINDILEGIVFDEEPKSMELRVAPQQGYDEEEGQDSRAMMMMETASVCSENLEQVYVTSRSERPCAFIPPPPPTEPPPPEEPVVDIASLASVDLPAPVLVDKETEVNDDNTSLAPSSAKSSPGAPRKRTDSFSSLGSIDTIEGLSLDFQMAIRLGEEAISSSPRNNPEVASGYKNEMALFVERMSKMAVETPEDGDGQLDESVSSLSLLGSDTNSDTGSVIQHIRSDSRDSRSGSEAGSLSRKDGKQIAAGATASGLRSSNSRQPETVPEMTGDFAVSEEITVPVDTVPPPPEFGDAGEDKTNESVEDEEEFFTETIEEIIIPMGPNGFDFSAAKKIPDVDTPKEHGPESPRERKTSTGVFRAEPVAVAPVSAVKTKSSAPEIKPKPTGLKPKEQLPKEKEEFVLTTEDLSSVTFLPPRPKVAKVPVETQPSTHVSTTSLVMEKHRSAATPSSHRYSEEPEYGNVKQHVSHISFKPKTEAENDSVLEEKPITLLNMPRMRPSPREENVTSFSDDSRSDSSSDPFTSRSAPRLLVNSLSSSQNSDRKSSINDMEDGSYKPVQNGQGSPTVDRNRRGSKTSSHSLDAVEQEEAFQAEYQTLQSQLDMWQEQLARNQTLLASQDVGPDVQTGHLKQLTEQMAMQQKMMQQLQNSMQALQEQKGQSNGHQENGSLASKPTANSIESKVQPIVSASTPPPPPPPPPPPSVQQEKPKIVKATTVAPKPKSKSRFEPVLDPREELMIAIRGFHGREGLRPVPVTKAKWVHSNRL
ncbi:flocculation protein FLO11 [Aplysia californica]|uniref:Flocculation protein FLO11 n=1 Tax=Aplysia californica TaxID=6500 RepID=A0ABM0K5Y4_APLCA|nr:flocculation protein FLO11 [Aplysia californica]